MMILVFVVDQDKVEKNNVKFFFRKKNIRDGGSGDERELREKVFATNLLLYMEAKTICMCVCCHPFYGENKTTDRSTTKILRAHDSSSCRIVRALLIRIFTRGVFA